MLPARDPLDLGIEPIDIGVCGRGVLALGFELVFKLLDAGILYPDLFRQGLVRANGGIEALRTIYPGIG